MHEAFELLRICFYCNRKQTEVWEGKKCVTLPSTDL